MRVPPQYAPCDLDLDLWPFDLESGVWVTCDVGTSVPILVFLGLSVLDLGPMYLTDRQTDRRQIASLLNVPAYGAGTSCRREAATIYPRPCTPCCGPAPAHTHVTPGLRHPARLASSSCGRHIYARCTRQTSSSDVRQHHCLMLPPRGRGITRLNKYG